MWGVAERGGGDWEEEGGVGWVVEVVWLRRGLIVWGRGEVEIGIRFCSEIQAAYVMTSHGCRAIMWPLALAGQTSSLGEHLVSLKNPGQH